MPDNIYISQVKTIRQQLQESSSGESAILMCNHILTRPVLMDELVKVYLEGPMRMTQRAAGVICSCAEKDPSLVLPHLAAMVRQLKEPEVSDAAKRNTLRILQLIDIPEELEGDLTDLCFKYLESAKEAVAIKAFAMTILFRLSGKYPELRHELRILIENQLPYQKPAFVSRGTKILAKLKK